MAQRKRTPLSQLLGRGGSSRYVEDKAPPVTGSRSDAAMYAKRRAARSRRNRLR